MSYWDDKKGKGILAGTHGNRVKAIKLRDVISQGIIFPIYSDEKGMFVTNEKDEKLYVDEGQNVANFLGFKKYEPTIPSSMAGDVLNIGPQNTIRYDIENLKKYPDILKENEEVIVTEKLHGTFCMLGYSKHLNLPDLIYNNMFVASKGLGAQGLVFKMNEKNLQQNIYTRVASELGLFDKLRNWKSSILKTNTFSNIIVMGEVFGKGVQDLHYGEQKATFRAFDLYIDGKYVDARIKYKAFEEMGIESVPILHQGKYERNLMDDFAKGLTTFGDHNVLEGIVITPLHEREEGTLGRVILKHINDEYLMRKNGTEYT